MLDTIPDLLHEAARDVFGIHDLRPFQQAMLGVIMQGDSCLGIARTNEGKSLCYQLPAVMISGMTVVVSPLQSLMRQQVDTLNGRGIPTACLTADVDMHQAQEIYRRMETSDLQIIYVSPERLCQAQFMDRLVRCDVRLLVVDEAHLISEWSHNFRPDYLKLREAWMRLHQPQVIAVTATAPPATLQCIQEMFDIPDERVVLGDLDRPEITLHVAPADNRLAQTLDAIEEHPEGPSVVYVARQKTSKEVAEELQGAGIDAIHYHAGLQADERREVERRYLAGEVRVIVSTTAFGLGVDKPDIRSVVLYDPPRSPEALYQQIGRAARDGAPSTATVLHAEETFDFYREATHKGCPQRQQVGLFLLALETESMLHGAVYLSGLAHQHELRTETAETVVAWLELAGRIRTGRSYDRRYRVELAEERQLPRSLRDLLAHGDRGWKWRTVDARNIATATGMSELQAVAQLNRIPAFGSITFQSSIRTTEYKVLVPGLSACAKDFHRRLVAHRDRELDRLAKVQDLFDCPEDMWPNLIAHLSGD